jgi:hypothetical protein
MSTHLLGVRVDDLEQAFESQIRAFSTLQSAELVNIYAAWVSTATRSVPNTPTHTFSVRLVEWLHSRILDLVR